MKLLLDTHLLIWVLTGDVRLPNEAYTMIFHPYNDNYFSVISVWEVAIKHIARPNNITFTGTKFAERCREAGFKPLAINDYYVAALETRHRPEDAPPHKDPFDRMLIAQAKSEGMFFLTHDRMLPYYQEDCIIFV